MFIATPAYLAPSSATERTATDVLNLLGGSWNVSAGHPWIGNVRSDLLGLFLESGATHLLWLDADVSFEADVARRLLSLEVPIATCTYRKRRPPHTFNLRAQALELGRLGQSAMGRLLGERVIAVERDGLGCCLMKRAVGLALYDRYRAELGYGDRVHLFAHGVVELDGKRFMDGEDGAFFDRVHACGFQPWCMVDATVMHDGVRGNLGEELDG